MHPPRIDPPIGHDSGAARRLRGAEIDVRTRHHLPIPIVSITGKTSGGLVG
jgi:hypothetical protein